MSVVAEAWDSGEDSGRCTTSTLCHYLEERDLLGHGRLRDGSFSDRDLDRARLLKAITNNPQGIRRTTLVHLVLKGTKLYDSPHNYGFADVDGNALDRHSDWLDRLHGSPDWDELDGSDSDYKFTYRFTRTLEECGFVRLNDTSTGCFVTPTLECLDLISEGTRETTTSANALVYDRQFCSNILKAGNRLTDGHKETLANSLQRYIDRVEDYRLLFDVSVSNGFRQSGSKTMTKRYKTRFNDDGRIRKMLARYNQALDEMKADADNAVLVTLTSDPGTLDDPDRPDPRSISELTELINPNFHRLTQYMKSDPSTKGDTRKSGVLSYATDRADEVTSRPRKKLDYLKALEFTERGLPHLHVLFFDVPTKESGELEGCPWLMHKQELSDKWSDYGQGQIVDVYPLTYRDDLNDVEGTEFANDDGFVCWYRYGDNELDDDRAEDLSRSHQIDMAGEEDNPMQKTAGQYLGKYLSMTFASLLDASGEDLEEREGYTDKFARWKLGMYWATGKQFWSISRRLERKIDRDDRLPEEVDRAVRWASKHDVQLACERLNVDTWPGEAPIDGQRAKSTVSQAVTVPFVQIDHVGTYHFSDLPGHIDTTARSDLDPVTADCADSEEPVNLTREDRPPPMVSVWSETG
ncbi:hypothetical protein [Halorussus halobius]|uniref:hypothetical protein n=1 Tax=Halorussus halobius TaxID=1710537 RepID=UPI00109283DB|nr:hypothetical protein [Halorussus halobius]